MYTRVLSRAVPAVAAFWMWWYPVAAQEPRVERIAEGLVFPEGPAWHSDGYLLFSDVHDSKIMKLLPDGTIETWLEKGKKTNGLVLSPDGKTLFACCYSERELLAIDVATREIQTLSTGWQGRGFNNVNDIARDPQGNLFFTDPKWGASADDIQGVFVHSADGVTTLAVLLDKQPNGVAITHDGKWLFVSRSGALDVWKFPVLPGGRLGTGSAWAKVEAEPDGMAVDGAGNVLVALAGNGKVCVLSPEGQVLRLIPVVDRMATNCEFQGNNDKVLYVTGGGRQGQRTGAVFRITLP